MTSSDSSVHSSDLPTKPAGRDSEEATPTPRDLHVNIWQSKNNAGYWCWRITTFSPGDPHRMEYATGIEREYTRAAVRTACLIERMS